MLYRFLKRMIEREQYESKQAMQGKLDVFFAAGRITEDNYNELTELLGA